MTHRAILFSALASGTSLITTAHIGRDNLQTLKAVAALGARYRFYASAFSQTLAEVEGVDYHSSTDDVDRIEVDGVGARGFSRPEAPLECGNSGTTARLLCGALAGFPLEATLVGDASLSKRPFKRVTEPLQLMGAQFSSEHLPLTIHGSTLNGIAYVSPRASAQVKSAILLAGLRASGAVSVVEPTRSRDHTERMFSLMGCEVSECEVDGGAWKVSLPSAGEQRLLRAAELDIPGDFSSASFLIAAATLLPNSEVVLKNVGINPTRTGLLPIFRRMGASIEVLNEHSACGEVVADLRVRTSQLRGVDVDAREVVYAIDEIPILSVVASFAEGRTRISGAEELRVKESDRLAMMAKVLTAFGVSVEEFPDGMLIAGARGRRGEPQSRPWQGVLDHRIAMSAAVLELVQTGAFEIEDRETIETSFPTFVDCFARLLAQDSAVAS